MSSLWDRLEQQRLAERERLREKVRRDLARALAELVPGAAVIVFGSLVEKGRFHKMSDVDIALLEEPQSGSVYSLQAKLEERLGRPVDLVLLPETRLRQKIESTGEKWTN